MGPDAASVGKDASGVRHGRLGDGLPAIIRLTSERPPRPGVPGGIGILLGGPACENGVAVTSFDTVYMTGE